MDYRGKKFMRNGPRHVGVVALAVVFVASCATPLSRSSKLPSVSVSEKSNVAVNIAPLSSPAHRDFSLPPTHLFPHVAGAPAARAPAYTAPNRGPLQVPDLPLPYLQPARISRSIQVADSVLPPVLHHTRPASVQLSPFVQGARIAQAIAHGSSSVRGRIESSRKRPQVSSTPAPKKQDVEARRTVPNVSSVSPRTERSAPPSTKVSRKTDPARDRSSVQPSIPVSAHVEGSIGKNTLVSFPGNGWIYLGTKTGSDAVNFENKSVAAGKSQFAFRIDRPGDYTLMFQRQNLKTGEQESRNIAVQVAPATPDFGGAKPRGYAVGGGAPAVLPTENIASTAQAPVAASDSQMPSPSSDVTAGSVRQGANQAGNAVTGSTASAAAKKESSKTGATAVDSHAGSASAGLSGTVPAASTRTSKEPQFDLSTPSGMLAAARYDMGHKNGIEAGKLLSSYLTKYSSAGNADEAYFLLGQLYEQDPKMRNIRKALEYYTVLREKFPFSEYWEKAGKRIQYLNQHFIYVR